MKQRKNRELFLLSLRVLAQSTGGNEPSQDELAMLHQHAEPSEAELPLDELCCALISRELGSSQ